MPAAASWFWRREAEELARGAKAAAAALMPTHLPSPPAHPSDPWSGEQVSLVKLRDRVGKGVGMIRVSIV